MLLEAVEFFKKQEPNLNYSAADEERRPLPIKFSKRMKCCICNKIFTINKQGKDENFLC